MKTKNNIVGPRAAFTLIELLVVIAVIALLISLILPSLGGARRTAWNVLCQNNLRQIGIATQTYFDDQKDPVFFKLGDTPGGPFEHTRVVDALQANLGDAGNKPFDCPAAKGLSSVRDPVNVGYLLSGGRVFVKYVGGSPFPIPGAVIEKYTEYWFNDSWTPASPAEASPGWKYPYGVSGQRMRLIKWPQFLVMTTDALDEFPRHEGGKGNATGRANEGKSNLLFGDQSVKMKSYREYQEEPDPVGAPAPFYNWGHLYPRV